VKIVDTLPNPALINKPAKAADMICISCKGLCGEDNVRVLREEEVIISGMAGWDS
jgi:hypothetical protein